MFVFGVPNVCVTCFWISKLQKRNTLNRFLIRCTENLALSSVFYHLHRDKEIIVGSQGQFIHTLTRTNKEQGSTNLDLCL